MKTLTKNWGMTCRVAMLLCWCVALSCALPHRTGAQVIIRRGGGGMPEMPEGMPPGMNMPGGGGNPSSSGGKDSGGPWLPNEPLPTVSTNFVVTTNADGTKITNSPDDIQLSFQGANIDMIVQWLAQTTGKTVIKHPRVQCQLTITSSKKVSKREALVLVYRALALEGFSVIESEQSIMIVPAGEEPKMSPEVVDNSGKLPEGRVRVVKVFSLQHVQALDIRDRVRGALTDKGTIDVNERNNQLIVTDYTDNIRLATELIDALDTNQPEDMAVRVISLKSVSATALAKEIAPLYQKSGNKSVDIAADDRANALFVLSSAANYESLMKLVSSLDTEDAQEKSLETFTLKNADAEDVAKQLQDLSENQGVSSRYVYFYGQQDSSASKKFNVVADRRRNAVIVQAVPTQMPEIKKIIDQLDAPVSDDNLAPTIYHCKYVSAVDLEDVLNELFLKKTTPPTYYDLFNDNPQPSADRNVGRMYGKVRITSEPYSNAIIITSNSRENLAAVLEVIDQLDRKSEAGESTLRVGLKFAMASSVANNLNILFAKNGSPPFRNQPAPNQQNNNQNSGQQPAPSSSSGFDLEQNVSEEGYYPWIGGQPDNLNGRSTDRNASQPVSDLIGRVRAVADQRGNAVIVSANVHFFPEVLKLIADLDAPADQVSIEARILEVSSDYVDQLGVRFSPNGSQEFTGDDFDNSIIGSGSVNYQKGFGGTTSVNTPAATSATGIAQQLAQLRSGVVSGSVNMDLLVQFLKKNTDATVLGEPQITINDNELGRLFVGQYVPIPAYTQISSVGSQNTSITYTNIGVILEVTPHINNFDDVQLKIHVESSDVAPGQTVLGGAVFDSRNFRTDLTAKDGQTLVLGGIIQRNISDIDRKTPFLGDIPGLRWMFKKSDKSSQRVELMVFLRTKVVHSPEATSEILHDVNLKTPLLKAYEEEHKNDDKKKK